MFRTPYKMYLLRSLQRRNGEDRITGCVSFIFSNAANGAVPWRVILSIRAASVDSVWPSTETRIKHVVHKTYTVYITYRNATGPRPILQTERERRLFAKTQANSRTIVRQSCSLYSNNPIMKYILEVTKNNSISAK